MSGVSVGGAVVLFVLELGLLAVIALPVMVDIRTGRGYVLGALPFLLLICTILVLGTYAITAQHPTKPTPGIHPFPATFYLLVFYSVLAAYATLTVALAAAIVAGISRQWRWVVGLVVAILVPTLVAVLPHHFLDLEAGPAVQYVGFLGMLVIPQATVLAHSVTRIIHPVPLALARQPRRSTGPR